MPSPLSVHCIIILSSKDSIFFMACDSDGLLRLGNVLALSVSTSCTIFLIYSTGNVTVR